MGGDATRLGPFIGGLHNSSGTGEFIENDELYELTNLEVDTDGSLANRPEINLYTVSGLTTNNMSILGTYLPVDGRKFIVCFDRVNTAVHLVNVATGVSAFNTSIDASCCVQFNNRLWVPARPGAATSGGYFDAPTGTTLTWTAVASMPKGEATTIYRDRMFIAAGLTNTSTPSRCWFSVEKDPSQAWNTGAAGDWFDVAIGNGQQLVDVKRLGNDVVLFKEHSTHRFTFTVDPKKGELVEVDGTIGVPALNCIVVYNNNTIYALHDNAVYEMFQFTYSRISNEIDMSQITDTDLWSKDQYGVTLHRDRLFVRYFKNLYVYSLRVKRWCKWDTLRKFSKVVVIPSATVGLDQAFAASASQSLASQVYTFKDSRFVTDTGGTTDVAAVLVDKTVYGTGGTRVNSYSISPPAGGNASTDWVYLVHANYWETSKVVPSAPNFTSLTPGGKYGGVQGGGIELYVLRKRFEVGDTSYTVTLDSSNTRFCRVMCLLIRGGSDGPVSFGLDAIPRSGMAAPSTAIARGGLNVKAKSLVLSIHSQNCNPSPNATPDVDGAIFVGNSPGTSSTSFIDVAQATYTLTQPTTEVTFTRVNNADQGRIVAFQMAIDPQSIASSPVNERFTGKIITKTYDFDVPHAYKVLFWWGVSVATSGQIRGTVTVPNAGQNLTYQKAKDLYNIWSQASLGGVRWSNNESVIVTTVQDPSLGKFSRKFLKMLKKLRFRQIYYTVEFDIISNAGLADAALRLYDLTVFIRQKQTVVKETS